MTPALPVSGWDNPFDQALMEFVVDHRTIELTAVANGVMWVGTTIRGVLLLAAAATIVVVALKAWRMALAAALALVASVVTTAALKLVFERPRPPTAFATVITSGYSFPSTQACETAAIAVALVLTAPWAGGRAGRPMAGLLATATVVVGVCMVYLGAHWPTDVLAGWALGAIIGVAVGRATTMASRPRDVRRQRVTGLPRS